MDHVNNDGTDKVKVRKLRLISDSSRQAMRSGEMETIAQLTIQYRKNYFHGRHSICPWRRNHSCQFRRTKSTLL